jgi:hypothetical protein
MLSGFFKKIRTNQKVNGHSYFTGTYKIILALITVLLLTSNKCSEDYGYEELPTLLERANLIFVIPKDCDFVPIIKNNQVYYNLAYKLKSGIEIRYHISPYDSLLSRYNAYLDRKAKGIKPVDPEKGEYTEYMSNPNDGYKSYFHAIIFNITEKTDSSFKNAINRAKEFPPEAVKKEFNADWGAYAFCKLDKEFGQDYEVCSVNIIHKKDCGMVVCFRLFRDPDHAKQLLANGKYNDAYYNMQFYKADPPMEMHPKGIDRIFSEE